MCHQAIEKALKAIYSKKHNAAPPRIHNLARLLKLTDFTNKIPADLLEITHQLNPLNIASRYPDEELTKINKFIEFVSKHVTVERVILYGSWANGSPTELSDIDLAIFSPDFGKDKQKYCFSHSH